MKYYDWAMRFIKIAGAYKRVFNNPTVVDDVKIVLADLVKQAPSDPTIKVSKPYDEKEVFIHIGRRQIVSHIIGQIGMTETQLNKLVKDAQAKDENPNNIKGM